ALLAMRQSLRQMRPRWLEVMCHTPADAVRHCALVLSGAFGCRRGSSELEAGMTLYNFHSLLSEDLSGWKMAGRGGFRPVSNGAIESHGGPGLLWYEAQMYENFILKVEWRTMRGDDNSGVFIRCPPLADDPQPAIERGYEIQID